MKFHTGALNISELMSRETCEGWFQPFSVLWELHTCLLAIASTLTFILALRVVEVVLECHAELATRIRYQIYYMNTAIDTHLSRIHFQQIACKELHIKAVFEEALLCGHSQIEYFMSNLCVF